MQEVQELQGKGLAAPDLEHPRGTAQTPAATPIRGYRGQQQPILVRRTLLSHLSCHTATTSCCRCRMICTAEQNLPLFCPPPCRGGTQTRESWPAAISQAFNRLAEAVTWLCFILFSLWFMSAGAGPY